MDELSVKFEEAKQIIINFLAEDENASAKAREFLEKERNIAEKIKDEKGSG